MLNAPPPNPHSPLQIFDVQLLSGPQQYELQVDTAGEEFFRSFDVWFLVNKGECDVHARKDTN